MARTSERRKISIRPTAPSGENQYTDISLTGLLGVYGVQIGSYRQVMWTRYGFFLVAHLAFLPLLVARISEPALLLSGAGVGMFVCWFWYSQFLDDRQVLIWWIREASRFRYSHLSAESNLFVFMLRQDQVEHAKRIYWSAGIVISLFFVLYPAVAIYSGWNNVKSLLLKIS